MNPSPPFTESQGLDELRQSLFTWVLHDSHPSHPVSSSLVLVHNARVTVKLPMTLCRCCPQHNFVPSPVVKICTTSPFMPKIVRYLVVADLSDPAQIPRSERTVFQCLHEDQSRIPSHIVSRENQCCVV